MVTACSVGVLLVADVMLKHCAQRRNLPWVALSPVLICEAQVGGHVDTMSTLALLVALVWLRRQRECAVGAAIGVGAAIKLLPAIALLPMIAIGGWQTLRRSGASAAVVVALSYGGALLLGLAPLGGLDSFFGKCQFGSPLYALAAFALGPTWSRVLLAILFVCALALIAIRARQRRKLEPAILLAVAAPLFLTPVVYPWYLMALVPLTALYPRAWMIGWVVTLPLTYEVIDRFDAAGVWEPAAWPLLLVALAWLVGGVIDIRRWQRERVATR
jgi:hypothetical protein